MALNHTDMLVELRSSQDADEEHRLQAKEANLFVNKRDGQWEPHIYSSWSKRPRYTFDQVSPVLDGVLGEMETKDFGVMVTPYGDGATKDKANKMAGIIRMIEGHSYAKHIYNQAARDMVTGGISGWRIIQRTRPGNPFIDDLVIDEIPNFDERVWFNEGAVKRDMSDATKCWVLTAMPLSEYKKAFPEGSGMSVGDNMYYHAYYRHMYDYVVVGELYYEKTVPTEYVLLNNGKVYEVDEDLDRVRDELFARGLRVEDTAKQDKTVFCHRLFDGGDWLEEKTETIFTSCPVVPCFANYKVIEHNLIYYGLVEKLMDPQRVLNYSESKKVAESALKPVEKTWMAKEQATSKDVLSSLADSNVNSDAHQFYDHVDNVPPPFKHRPMEPDTVLINIAQATKQYIRDTSNYNDAIRGVGLSGQSGDTVRTLQDKGNLSNYKYHTALEIALSRTGQLLLDAIPHNYDTPVELTLINLDGTTEPMPLHEFILDEQTGEYVAINDVSVGKYIAECSSGPSFKNRREEASRNMIAAAQVNPMIMELGADVFLRNQNSPELELVAERLRAQLAKKELIPFNQLTEQERKQLELSKRTKKPDPMDQIAKAELQKSKAQTMDILSKMQDREKKAQLELNKMILDYEAKKAQLTADQEAKIIDTILAQSEVLNRHADTLKKLRDALGVDAIVSREGIEAYAEQADLVLDTQNRLESVGL